MAEDRDDDTNSPVGAQGGIPDHWPGPFSFKNAKPQSGIDALLLDIEKRLAPNPAYAERRRTNWRSGRSFGEIGMQSPDRRR
jgi:hypothetical protein